MHGRALEVGECRTYATHALYTVPKLPVPSFSSSVYCEEGSEDGNIRWPLGSGWRASGEVGEFGDEETGVLG